MQLRYPSERFPALSTVSVDAPPAWRAVQVADAALTLRRDDPAGTFAANLLVSVRRFPVAHTLADAVANLTSALSLLPAAHDVAGGAGVLSGREAALLSAAVTDPEAGELVQLGAVTVVPVGAAGPVDVIEVRATVGAADRQGRDEAMAILTSLAITRPG